MKLLRFKQLQLDINMFYSKTTNSFYVKEIHGDAMPLDVISISRNNYQLIQKSISIGGVLYSDNQGNPAVRPMPEPSQSELQSAINAKHRQLLKDTDWYVLRLTETGVAIPDNILQLRAESRAAITE